MSSNSLLVKDSTQAVLFDSGYVSHAQQLLSLITTTLREQPLDLIVNSHLHSDHCGGNALLQSFYPQVDIQIPSSQFDHVKQWNDSCLTYSLSGQNCNPYHPTRHLNHGDLIQTSGYVWEVLAAPGHDNDECIFFERSLGLLFSADSLWENGFGIVFPEFLGGVGFENVSQTLDLIESLNPRVVMPGHGSIFNDAKNSIQTARRKLDVFVRSPETHAKYSAKVLLKFKLLEIQSSEYTDFFSWAMDVKMLNIIHDSFFSHLKKEDWIHLLIDELGSRGAAVIESGLISNK